MARPPGRSRQRRPEGPPPARRTSGRERAAREVEPLAGEVLRLQRSGGNEAVTTMLAQRDLFDEGETEVDQTEEEAGFEQTDVEQAGGGFEEGGGGAGREQTDGDRSGFEESEAEEKTTGGPGAPGDATLVMDDPIGTLSLVSSSQTDAAGRQFSVKVRSSTKDPLLFAASATGQPVGTVRIGGTVLQNVTIPSVATGTSGTVDMRLSSGTGTPPAPVGSTLVMDDPIGAL